MKFSEDHNSPPEDQWVWGRETLLWGYETSHAYTIKLLKPKVGREGCLSLQYHHEKSESWHVLKGTAWALIIQGENVITRVMKSGDFQNLPTGTIHRLMGLSDDLVVLECSTPDAHAADKSAPKDVVRLHCVHGRECESMNSEGERALVNTAIEYTEKAIATIDSGGVPEELNLDHLIGAAKI